MKSFWFGGALGFIFGVGITFLYFSLASLFSTHSKLAPAISKIPNRVDENEGLSEESEPNKTRSVGA